MRRTVLIAFLIFLLNWSIVLNARAHEGDPEELEIDYIQKPGAQVPLDTLFTAEDGTPIRLGDIYGERPVVLMFAYYECPTLCGVALEDLGNAVKQVDLEPGADYNIAVISIDPRETDRIAAQAKEKIFRNSALDARSESWKFLTGTEEAIHEVTTAAGFQYVYDEEMDMYFHPTGVVVTTPEGRIARYINGIGYDPLSLRLAIVEAAGRRIGSVRDVVGLLCYQYDEATGQYSLAIIRLVQAAGIASAGILGAAIILMKKREKKTGSDHP